MVCFKSAEYDSPKSAWEYRENKIEKMGRGDGVNERLLENENNRLSDQLAGKISKLKQISIEMKVRISY